MLLFNIVQLPESVERWVPRISWWPCRVGKAKYLERSLHNRLYWRSPLHNRSTGTDWDADDLLSGSVGYHTHWNKKNFFEEFAVQNWIFQKSDDRFWWYEQRASTKQRQPVFDLVPGLFAILAFRPPIFLPESREPPLGTRDLHKAFDWNSWWRLVLVCWTSFCSSLRISAALLESPLTALLEYQEFSPLENLHKVDWNSWWRLVSNIGRFYWKYAQRLIKFHRGRFWHWFFESQCFLCLRDFKSLESPVQTGHEGCPILMKICTTTI